jgi:hypothetical protein
MHKFFWSTAVHQNHYRTMFLLHPVWHLRTFIFRNHFIVIIDYLSTADPYPASALHALLQNFFSVSTAILAIMLYVFFHTQSFRIVEWCLHWRKHPHSSVRKVTGIILSDCLQNAMKIPLYLLLSSFLHSTWVFEFFSVAWFNYFLLH